MNASLDVERVVTDWLREEATASGSDRVLAAALGRVSTVRQERRRPRWMGPRMGPAGKLAIVAAAAAVVIAVVSLDVLNASLGIHGGGTVASPTALPSPSPTPTAAVYPPGFDIPPVDRQSLTVDGVPLSFSVPTTGWGAGIQLKESDGTFRPRSLYIGKHSARGQAAEAVVFWTTFPGGVNADPCANLLRPRIGGSAADLAAAIATAPGTYLVTGPLDVTLGGHEAKHVVLTVHEDLGCDPGYFFTWPEECWGTCWGLTRVGDTIGVWVVEVDGRRLVIEAETTNDAGSELEQEVQQIVESIGFE